MRPSELFATRMDDWVVNVLTSSLFSLLDRAGEVVCVVMEVRGATIVTA